MHIRYAPKRYFPSSPHDAGTLPETEIIFVDENTILYDGEEHAFPSNETEWPDIASQTHGKIRSAYRDEAGELWLNLQRYFTTSCGAWDTGEYSEVHS